MIIIEDKENKLACIVEDFEQINFPMENTQLGYFSTIYYAEDFDFKYNGLMQLNDRDTYVVETKSNERPFSLIFN